MATLSTHADLLFHLEMDWCIYMVLSGHPDIAAHSARVALAMAIQTGRADLLFQASDMLDTLTTEIS